MRKIIMILTVGFLFTSCASYNSNLTNPTSGIAFEKSDFIVSEQVSAKATSTRILGIDWLNIFENKKMGELTPQLSDVAPLSTASIPIVGGIVGPLTTELTSGIIGGILGIFIDNTEELATHNLITENSDNDVVLYPRYQTKTAKPILGIGILYKKTEVTVTARLGKLKE